MHNPKNEQIKRHYLAYLEEARRMSPKNTDQVAAVIALFEASTGYKDFERFHIEQTRAFKRWLQCCLQSQAGRDFRAAARWLNAEPAAGRGARR